jgi:hypothetical protein
MNTVANSVGVRHGKPEGLLGRLVRAYALRANGPLEDVERDCMRIAPAGDRKARYGFLFGTGVVHGFLAEYYRNGEATPLVAAKTLGRGIASAVVHGDAIRRMARPFRGSVEFPGPGAVTAECQAWPSRDYLAVAAGTIGHIGLNFKPFYRYAERAGRFHVLGIHASPMGFVAELSRIHRGVPMRPGKAFDHVTEAMVLRSCDGPLRYMIDGDLHECATELSVSIGPRVRFVVVP